MQAHIERLSLAQVQALDPEVRVHNQQHRIADTLANRARAKHPVITPVDAQLYECAVKKVKSF